MTILSKVTVSTGRAVLVLGLMFFGNFRAYAQQSDIADHPDVASNIALLEAWLTANMAYQGQPGVSVAIVYDQQLIYAKGFGYADVASQKPMSDTSIFRIASHSKLFTAIALLQLRDQGKLRLDDPVVKHLPWFKVDDTFPDDPPITIRHLITHTSGLPREAGSEYWINYDFPTSEDVKERLSDITTAFPTERQWKYSNLALAIAGDVVTAVSGQLYSDYVQKNVIDPLGMSQTSVVFPKDHEPALAAGYGRRMPDGTRAVMPFVDARGMASATGVSSSVKDMAKFVSWQFRLYGDIKNEVLSANTLREMQRVHWVQKDWSGGWGLGFAISHNKDRDLIGHGGGYPGYLTNTQISLDEKIGVIVFTNSLDGAPRTILARVFDWVAPAITKAVKGVEGLQPDVAWRKYEGTYRTPWGDSHVLTLEGKLAMINPTASNPKPGAFTLVPVGENLFKLTGENGGSAIGELVTFELGDDGNARRMKTGVNWANRVYY